ncbi:MAG: (Fe-S)-binding protein [Bacteroidales bacterium]|nr:(Fe-S)-binding protein [Bacteroidales bacterium]
MKFDYFVLPFAMGLAFLFIYLAVTYAIWFFKLEKDDKKAIRNGFLSRKLFTALGEIISESLLHRKIFRKNLLLGFMHMSLAFGWFLLIAIGNLESRIYEPTAMNPPYVPIFFKFFNTTLHPFPLHKFFSALMDLLLLLVLTGVILAWGKRIVSRAYGMKRTTKLSLGDKLAMSSLWFIFPLRLLAESFTHGVYAGGDFLTGTVGNLLNSILPSEQLYYPAWWAYSLSLGLFFVALPFSRYMHIPTEVVLIFSRHFGLREKKVHTPVTDVEVRSCSRCGICIDTCQLSFAGGIKNVQSAYQIRAIRYHHIQPAEHLNCMMCGRCEIACPVGINIKNVRLISRNELNGYPINKQDYVPINIKPVRADVIYFGGCMTHQTPSIKKSMIKILQTAGINYWFMDEEGGICCGRPSILTGHTEQAKIIIDTNLDAIRNSHAKILLTSCPICYKVFKQDYQLDIEVLHHTEFINNLINAGKISVAGLYQHAVYHDPCELSRDIRVYEEPRNILRHMVNLIPVSYERDNSLCCGGSLANLSIAMDKRKEITRDAYLKLTVQNPDYLVTSCPQCKKTFEKTAEIPIRDIAEIVCEGMQKRIAVKKTGQFQRTDTEMVTKTRLLTTN